MCIRLFTNSINKTWILWRVEFHFAIKCAKVRWWFWFFFLFTIRDFFFFNPFFFFIFINWWSRYTNRNISGFNWWWSFFFLLLFLFRMFRMLILFRSGMMFWTRWFWPRITLKANIEIFLKFITDIKWEFISKFWNIIIKRSWEYCLVWILIFVGFGSFWTVFGQICFEIWNT